MNAHATSSLNTNKRCTVMDKVARLPEKLSALYLGLTR